MDRITTITLDLDDTLWPIHPVIARAERELRAWLKVHYPRVPELFGQDETLRLRKQVVVEFEDRSHDLTFLRKTVLGRMASAAGYDEEMVELAFDQFNTVRNDVELFPEAHAALTRLQASYTIIAVTNGNADLSRIGIKHLFDGEISAARAGAAKPARAIFEQALAIGGSAPQQTLHVGDHPHHDILGARRAGLRTAWINRDNVPWPQDDPLPDHTVRHMGELADLLTLSSAATTDD